RDQTFVVTAAHCLPPLPPAANFTGVDERTYPSLIGPLGEQPSVWVECLFADPFGDLALLGSPNNQDLPSEADAYDDLVNGLEPFQLGLVPRVEPWNIDEAKGRAAWMLSLELDWFRCEVVGLQRSLMVRNAAAPIVGGLSGSPILSGSGRAL